MFFYLLYLYTFQQFYDKRFNNRHFKVIFTDYFANPTCALHKTVRHSNHKLNFWAIWYQFDCNHKHRHWKLSILQSILFQDFVWLMYKKSITWIATTVLRLMMVVQIRFITVMKLINVSSFYYSKYLLYILLNDIKKTEIERWGERGFTVFFGFIL